MGSEESLIWLAIVVSNKINKMAKISVGIPRQWIFFVFLASYLVSCNFN